MSIRRSPALLVLLLLPALGAMACSDEPAPTAPPDGSPPAVSPTGQAPSGPYVPGRVLVRFKSGGRGLSVASSHGAVVGARVLDDIYVLGVERGREMSTIAALRKDPRVVFAEPDYLRTFGDPLCTDCSLPVDIYFGLKWDLHNDGDVEITPGSPVATTGAADADIDWLEAFDHLGPSVSGSARIAIMDTGIRRTHEDLAGRVIAEYDFDADDPDASDDQGHGTHVAGISGAAGDNEVGVAGVAYGPGIGFLIAKVCHVTLFGLSAECPSSALSAGIRWATDNGANVINISLGGPDSSFTEQAALQYARAHDVLPFCAAGNEGQGSVLYPAKFPECVAVSATDWGDDLASYSNWGPEVELSAPGGDGENGTGYSQIASTCFGADDEYCYKAGTSMATPQATGLGALLFALGLTDDEAVLDRMRNTADDLGPAGWDERFGYGRINVYNAVADLSGGDPNEPPTASFTYACQGLECDFTDASSDSDGTVVEWSWTFGDGGTSTLQNPSHTYACSGTFSVGLRVTDDRGRSRSTSQSVTVSANVDPEGPGTIANLDLWLRADRITGLADGDPVSMWTDQSGSCNNATQSVGSKRPTYRVNQVNGHPAVVFDTNDGMATSFNPPYTSMTIFAVYSSRAGNSGYLLNGGFGFFMGPYAGRYRVYTGLYLNGPSVTGGRWVMHTFRQSWSASLAEHFIDGSPAGTSSRTRDASTISLGRQGTYSAALDGSVAELIIYMRNLTDEEMQQVHAYLEQKYVGAPPPNGPPAAEFTSDCTGLSCTFTDQSTDDDGSVTAWSWDFGDGGTSTEQSPSHSYAEPGTYTVTLTVTDDDGATDDASAPVTVTEPPPNGPPTAAFTDDCTGLACTFTDQSTDADGSVTAWSWAFGDGGTSTEQSPSHPYAAAGTYTVTLTVTDNDGATDDATASVTVTEPPPPVFEDPSSLPDLVMWLQADAIQGLADGDRVATWVDRSGLGNAATQSSSSKRPVYRVNQVNGLPALFFDAVDDGMSTPVNPTTSTTIIAVYASRAGQSGYLLNGGFGFFMGPYVGLYRTYTGSYLNGPSVTAGRWLIQTFRQSGSLAEQFVDGSPAGQTTNVRDPGFIQLARQGTYSDQLDGSVAELLIYDRTLTDQELQDVHAWLEDRYVGPPPPNQPPTASFVDDCAGLDCTFTDQSADGDGSVTAWSWAFGDGGTSTDKSPSHTYASAGTYTVTLTVTDDDGATDDATASVTVTEPPPNEPPTASFVNDCTDLSCTFTDQSADGDGSVMAWSWSFGDGGTSTDQSPSHTYASAGTYTVTLTVTDDDGATDGATASVMVTEPPPTVFEDPSSLPDLVMWLQADAIQGLADGERVATWVDRSGLGNAATQSSGGRQPIYRTNQVAGLPAVVFDAKNDGMSTPVNPSTSTTIIAVYASRAGRSGYLLNGGFGFFMGPYVGLYRTYTGSYMNGPGVTGGRWLIQTFRQSGSLAEQFIDGSPAGQTTRLRDPDFIQLAEQGTYSDELDGSVAELLIYDRTLTDAELQQVHAWLKTRYEIP